MRRDPLNKAYGGISRFVNYNGLERILDTSPAKSYIIVSYDNRYGYPPMPRVVGAR